MNSIDFDNHLEDMFKADAIRATLVPEAQKTFYLVTEPWTILEEPWTCQWFDTTINSLCEVFPVGKPYFGEKYAMFVIYDKDRQLVKNYVFLRDNYHTAGD